MDVRLFVDKAAIIFLHPHALWRHRAAIELACFVRFQHAGIGSGGGAPIDGLDGITAGNVARCGTNQVVDFICSRHVCCGSFSYSIYLIFNLSSLRFSCCLRHELFSTFDES